MGIKKGFLDREIIEMSIRGFIINVYEKTEPLIKTEQESHPTFCEHFTELVKNLKESK